MTDLFKLLGVIIGTHNVVRQIEIPVISAEIELDEGEVSEALIAFAIKKYAAGLPNRKLLESKAHARSSYDGYWGHLITLSYEADPE